MSVVPSVFELGGSQDKVADPTAVVVPEEVVELELELEEFAPVAALAVGVVAAFETVSGPPQALSMTETVNAMNIRYAIESFFLVATHGTPNTMFSRAGGVTAIAQFLLFRSHAATTILPKGVLGVRSKNTSQDVILTTVEERLPATPLSEKRFGPEALRPRLTTGLPCGMNDNKKSNARANVSSDRQSGVSCD